MIADYFVIATGTSSTQVKSLSDYVETELKEQGIQPLHQEGYASSSWVLLDYGDVVVHIFTEQTRGFYDLERLWKDGAQLPFPIFCRKRRIDPPVRKTGSFYQKDLII